ncbi:hypothetical protein CGLAMM_06520 [Acetobacteraceae bacterium EV16G]|uniref:Uncharacterized protein n=1 Tax=Sorlinia euscelidii TaxID=3081148 RepID=A0ABU7U3F8_9PROT
MGKLLIDSVAQGKSRVRRKNGGKSRARQTVTQVFNPFTLRDKLTGGRDKAISQRHFCVQPDIMAKMGRAMMQRRVPQLPNRLFQIVNAEFLAGKSGADALRHGTDLAMPLFS